MKLNGFESFEKKLQVDMDKHCAAILNKTASMVVRDCKLNTPVSHDKHDKKRGFMRRSWRSERKGNIVMVYNLAHYSKHVEYGHRTRRKPEHYEKAKTTRKIVSRSARSGAFKSINTSLKNYTPKTAGKKRRGRGVWFVPGQFILRNAMRRAKSVLHDNLRYENIWSD